MKKNHEKLNIKDPLVLMEIKEEVCSMKISEEQLYKLAEKKVHTEKKYKNMKKGDPEVLIRAAKKELRSEFLPTKFMFEDPATEEIYDIDAVKVRKLFMTRLFRPKEGPGLLEPIKELILDNFVKKDQEEKKEKYAPSSDEGFEEV